MTETETLTIPDAEEWHGLFSTLHENPKALKQAVSELKRITEFYEFKFDPSFEETIEYVRSQPHNRSPCGHSPSFDQVAYTVLINVIGEKIVDHMNPEFQAIFWEYCERKSPQ